MKTSGLGKDEYESKRLLAKVSALDTLQEAVRQMKITEFTVAEIQALIPELFYRAGLTR